MITLTPKQIDTIHIRLTTTCTDVQIRRWATTGRTIEVSQFVRSRLIETVKIGPSGTTTVLP